jgi:hypothetical protein
MPAQQIQVFIAKGFPIKIGNDMRPAFLFDLRQLFFIFQYFYYDVGNRAAAFGFESKPCFVIDDNVGNTGDIRGRHNTFTGQRLGKNKAEAFA